jgi:hypothetical protein
MIIHFRELSHFLIDIVLSHSCYILSHFVIVLQLAQSFYDLISYFTTLN